VHEKDDNAARRTRAVSRTVAPPSNKRDPEASDGVARLNLLQRSAGNQAVARLLETTGLLNLQPAAPQGKDASKPSEPESYWKGEVKGWLGEHPAAYHTLNNFGDTPLEYVLRIKNTGYCLLDLETQYQYYKPPRQDRAWIAIAAQRGHTEEVTNGLPPHSSLHLRLYGERDATQPDQAYIEGTVEVILKK